jgi:hypothetical protein
MSMPSGHPDGLLHPGPASRKIKGVIRIISRSIASYMSLISHWARRQHLSAKALQRFLKSKSEMICALAALRIT